MPPVYDGWWSRELLTKIAPYVLGVSLVFKLVGLANLIFGRALSARYQVPYLAVGSTYNGERTSIAVQFNTAPSVNSRLHPSGLEVVCQDADLIHSNFHWTIF